MHAWPIRKYKKIEEVYNCLGHSFEPSIWNKAKDIGPPEFPWNC
jgi:hypothetical protein